MEDIRWKQRFQNFEKAYVTFEEAINAVKEQPKNKLFQMALIQSFEFTVELGWKTIKDFLTQKGLKTSFPKDIIKEAFSYNIIDNGEAWMEMIDDRNLTSHTYDEATAKKIVFNITNNYVEPIEQIYSYFKERV
jgi:nucleotidyltransferase substrate binding protein (TIGR01987 family)